MHSTAYPRNRSRHHHPCCGVGLSRAGFDLAPRSIVHLGPPFFLSPRRCIVDLLYHGGEAASMSFC